jgi:hypothetical protein
MPLARNFIGLLAALAPIFCATDAWADAHAADLTALELTGYQRWLRAAGEPDTTTVAPVTVVTAALRAAIAGADTARLDTLATRLAMLTERIDDDARYWYAIALVMRERWNDSLLQLKQLVASGNPQRFAPPQRAWVVTAIADQLFLVGARRQCRELYAQMARSELRSLRQWSSHQTANLDLLASDYPRAATAFAELCASVGENPLRAQACALAEVAGQLSRVQERGEPDGSAETGW